MPESTQSQDGTSSPLTVPDAAEKLEAFAGLLLGDEEQGTDEPQKPEPKGSKEADEEPETEVEAETEAEGDEPEAEETDAEEDEPSEPETEEADDAETPEPAKSEEPLHAVKVDGEEVKVTLDELKKGYSREADYTRKTQALAEQRKAVEAEQGQVRVHRETYAQQLEALHTILAASVPQEPDWDAVRRDAPDQYPRLYADWQRVQSRLNTVIEARQRVAAEQAADADQQRQQHVVAQRDALHAAMPEWRDPTKAKVARDEMVDYGHKLGFTDADMATIVDHRALLTLWKAMQYDKGQTAQQQQKAAGAEKISKVKTPPVKTAKPGPKNSRQSPSAKVQATLKRARSTGSIDDTAAALELILPDHLA